MRPRNVLKTGSIIGRNDAVPAPAVDPFAYGFWAKVGERAAENQEFLWIRNITEGMLEYAAERLLAWEEEEEVKEHRICIASCGGDLDEALALYSLIHAQAKPTIAYVFWAYSGALYVSLACDVRIGFPTTTVLLHDPWLSVEGRSDYIQDQIAGVELNRRVLQEIICSRTKITKRKLRTMARREWWMGAEEALKYGILTDILGA